MPKKFNLPILLIEKDNLKSEVIKQAKLIKKYWKFKSLNYSNLSGWQVTTDKTIVKIGKSDIEWKSKIIEKNYQ